MSMSWNIVWNYFLVVRFTLSFVRDPFSFILYSFAHLQLILVGETFFPFYLFTWLWLKASWLIAFAYLFVYFDNSGRSS